MTVNLSRKEINHICSVVSDEQIAKTNSYVMFLGHAHSGHSLIGAILDAHQDIAISNELNIPKLILDHDLSKYEIFKLTLYFSSLRKSWEGETNTGYKYKIKDGHQGSTITPIILGDKKGGGSTRIIRNHEGIFEKMYNNLSQRLKIIHVIRSPLDNIAAFAHYWGENLGANQVERYYENMETVLNLKEKYPKIFHTVNHTDFITNPKSQLEKIFKFLAINPQEQFLESCVRIVRPSENKRSEQLMWPESLLETIKNKNIEFKLTDY